MSGTPDHMAQARAEAVERVRVRLQGIDLVQAARRCGLDADADGTVEAIFLGRRLRVRSNPISVRADDGRPVSSVEEMLLLRYLEAEREYKLTGEEVPFRDLPGGAFYHVALARRTTQLLEKAFQNDLDRFRRALGRFAHEPLELGDASARVRVVGRVSATLIYHAGDDEFPPAADLLFDRAIASVYTPDEVAALATYLCVAFVRQA